MDRGFSEPRSQIEKAQSQMSIQRRKVTIPRMKDRAVWHVFCLGRDEASGNVVGYFEDTDDEQNNTPHDEELGEEDPDLDEETNVAPTDPTTQRT
jgi:hypothetical protein